MKFLLTAINAKYIHSNPAVYSLRSYAGEEGRRHMEIAEYTINNQSAEILADIYKRKPDVIAFSCYIWNWEMVKKLLPELQKVLPQIPIWLGGPEVSYNSQVILADYPFVTGIMQGEGEETCKELLEYYVKGQGALSGIKGLLYRFGEELVFTGERELTDIDQIPFPYENISDFENRIIYYESSRGCPFRCSYCLSSIDKSVRLKSLDKVKKELKFFIGHNIPQVKFVDRTFNCNHIHAMAIWQFIKEQDNGITNFHFEIAADILTEEEIALLGTMRPGLVQLEIGVQSTHEPTLNSICRKTNFAQVKKNVQALIQNRNIHIHLDLIAGLPYEDYHTFAESFNDVYACHPEQLQLGFLKVLSGSPMEREAAEHGIIYEEQPPYQVLFTRWLSYEQLLRLQQVEEMVELYYNSNQFINTLQVLELAFENPFKMYEKLADFYEEKGYFVNSPARSYRYQVLLDFACAYDKRHQACYRELLTFDLYLRENGKSRPDYAADLSPYRDFIRNFYQEEEEKRTYLPGYAAYNARQLMKMTHMEVFYYPVDAEKGKDKMKKKTEPDYVLFDYQDRNALTKDASIRRIKKEEHVQTVLALLDERYGTDYRCFLNHENAWQLLIATMLSAQCTDARVNIVTAELFKKYTSVQALAEADLMELEKEIHSTGFYHNKAKNIIACCQGLCDRFGGEVPRELEDLISLPGVGRKTANVVRGNIFHDPSIVVDTHVKRISKKLGFTGEEDPVKVEMDLMKVLPRDHWILYNIQIITFGREICKAPTPKCDICFLQEHCPDYQTRNAKGKGK